MEAKRPRTSPSSTTERSTCCLRRAERAQRRQLARPLRDRDRERVEDHERADEERDAAEAEQEVAEDVDELARPRRRPPPPAARPSAPGRSAGAIRSSRETSVGVGDAVLRRDRDRVVAVLPMERLRGRDVEDRDRRAPERVDLAELRDADQRVGDGRLRSRRRARGRRSGSRTWRRCRRPARPRCRRPTAR